MIDAAGCGPSGRCPHCQQPAARLHSRYWRSVAGLPVGDHRMIVRHPVRRLFCDQNRCRCGTFVEQVAGLTEPRHRCARSCGSTAGARASWDSWLRRPCRPGRHGYSESTTLEELFTRSTRTSIQGNSTASTVLLAMRRKHSAETIPRSHP
ncbi:transposase family protein [Streptomyces chattanoogensis]|uniref:transposase family protein n=1 Tax=Streptomyces chattanoogensis TaxID=66876 RepID=UPI00367653BB